MSVGAINASLQGIQNASASAAKHAAQLANFDQSDSELAAAAIGLKQDNVQQAISIAVLKKANDAERSVLSILA